MLIKILFFVFSFYTLLDKRVKKLKSLKKLYNFERNFLKQFLNLQMQILQSRIKKKFTEIKFYI